MIQDLTKKLLEAERECRWAKEGRAAAEKGEEFARRRAEAMESSSVSLRRLTGLPQKADTK